MRPLFVVVLLLCSMAVCQGTDYIFIPEEMSWNSDYRLVLVKGSKTWDEALDYCRHFYTGLASAISPQQLAVAKDPTARVWTGVRFLDGRWLTVSGISLGSQVPLPSCPAPHTRCGALNTGTDVWENRDCSEKHYFFCYKF